MKREQIIETLIKLFRDDGDIYALWLEGSDATGKVDEYSDIDMCALIDEDKVDEVFEKIQNRFEIDSIYENRNCDSERQLVFHVVNSDKYHVVDFNAYFHNVADTTFVKNDTIDVCKVIFDKCGAIQYKEYDAGVGADERMYWEKESAYRFSQISRVEKYCLRGLYPEAFVYYQKYVVEPLVFTLRMKYTPTKVWYYMVHISDHIPQEEVEKLNRILQVSGVDDIMANLQFAEEWYHELVHEIC